MVAAGEYVKLAKHGSAERILREHALDGNLDGSLGMLVEQLLERDRLDTADVAGVVVVDLIGELPPGNADLASVHHHDVITHVYVGAVVRLVLTLEAVCNLRGQTSERFAFGINQIPIAADAAGFGEDGPGRHGSVRRDRRCTSCRLIHKNHYGGSKKGGEVYSSRSFNAKPVRFGSEIASPHRN